MEDDDQETQELYQWIDEVPLSRPKKNIARDFSDGVLAAEVVKHFYPKIVDVHNYPSSSNRTQKENNWKTLNQKVLKRLSYQLTASTINDLVTCKPGAVEDVLKQLRAKMEAYANRKQRSKVEKEQLKEEKLLQAEAEIRAAAGGGRRGLRSDYMAEDEYDIDEHGRPYPAQRMSPRAPPQRSKRAVAPPVVHAPPPANTRPNAGGASKRKPRAPKHEMPTDDYDRQLAQMQMGSSGGAGRHRAQHHELAAAEADQEMAELRQQVVVLQSRLKKADQLLRLKDGKIEALTGKLEKYGLA